MAAWMYISMCIYPLYKMDVNSELHTATTLLRGTSPGIHCVGGRVSRRACLDAVEKKETAAVGNLTLYSSRHTD
jgi:hypothetical protein